MPPFFAKFFLLSDCPGLIFERELKLQVPPAVILWSTSMSSQSVPAFFKIARDSVRFIPIAIASEELTEEDKEYIPEEQLPSWKKIS